MIASSVELLAEDFVRVLGVRFHRVTQSQAVEKILSWIAEPSRRLVITAGPEFVMQTIHDEQLREIAHRADLVTADGIGIVWAARRKGQPVPERVTGVEMVYEALRTANERKQPLRVFILGASQESLNGCLQNLQEQFPNLVFQGHSGFFQPDETPSVIEKVAAFQPNLWLVGMGQPRQEKLMFEYLHTLPPCVGIGVGGSIDIWGGTVKRAPFIFRKLNIEWLHRLLKQPSRWRRQLALPRFMWKVMRSAEDAHSRPKI